MKIIMMEIQEEKEVSQEEKEVRQEEKEVRQDLKEEFSFERMFL